MADSGNIKVVVRCRPLNSRERNRGASNLIEVVDQHQLVLNPPGEGDSRENARATKKKAMPFSFDRSYGEDTEQHELFDYVGEELLQHSFNGFNTCVFAYGQTGSGKSHSMVGYAEAKGLIPLTCSKLFVDANKMLSEDSNLSITVEVSYIEIYNEKVRDLLNPKNKGNLRVREHPSLGPYVEDLSKLVVKDFNDIENLMDEGNKARTVAATNMNETSSRSHAVFTLVVTQKRKDVQTNLETEKVSRISLVDLAGSERANSTGATGSRLKEGANINRSLTTLGKVIAALAQASAEPAKGKKKVALENFVPYRDSVLTWLLKDSLGGNSKTAMIAAISPADYEETLSTLRYADQAKKIKNKAVVNEDPNAKLIRELKEELEMLRNRVQLGGGGDGEGTWDPSIPPEKQVVRYLTKSGEVKTVTKAELQDQLEQSEKIMESLNQSWEQKVAQTRAIQIEREKALEELGITVDKGNVGVHTPKSLPHLVNLNEDPLMSECLIYQLKPGSTSVTNVDSADTHEGVGAQIRLSGDSILPDHCTFENLDGVVTLQTKTESHTMVNGKKVTPEEPRRLRSGYRIILGEDFRHVFRFNHPEEVRKARDRIRLASVNGDETQGDLSGNVTRSDSPVSDANEGNVDWTYARREAALAAVHGHDVNFDALNEEDLEKLYEDIMKARSKKIGGTWRSESRLSSFDDNASETNSSELRPYSMSAYTDDTSLDPWGINADYDTPSFVPSASTPEPDQETQETIDLRKQVKDYQDQITKLQNVTSLDLPANYSRREKRLLRLALSKWRKQTSVTMAEDILQYAILLKEANVISRELRKNTTYQFAIVDEGELANPTSNLEAIVGLSEFDDVADTQLAHAPKPSVCVKVIDHKHKTVYLWSIGKLEQRLQKMRNLYGFIDRPEYGQHFNWSDPFYEDASNPFSFVGNALIPLTPLYRMVSATYADVPIFSRHTHAKIGACNVELRFVNVTTSSGQVGDGQGSGSNTNAELCVGQKLGFQLSVSTCRGLSRAEFEQVHIQIHTSAIAGEKNTEVLTSAACASDKDLKLRKTVAIVLDSSSIERLRGGYLPIEFFAKVNDAHMKGLEKYDADREAHRSIGQSPREEAKIYQNGNGDIERPELTVKSSSSGRLSEKEMVLEERHDILASVQICELSSAGTYKPVQVRSTSSLDPGAFYLRQGLQRKIVVQLRHESGQQFPWSSVTNLMLNNVRMLDNKGKMHTSTGEDITLNVPLKQQTLAFHGNGTTDLEAWAWWDSSMHDSIFLNRTTAANNRILLRLTCKIAVESCIEPVSLTMDIAVAIHGRDAKPPGKLYTMFESATLGSRVLMKSANVFAIRLTPPMTKKSQELWRLDTATKYVRGQEALEGIWKPRGVSLIHEYERFVTTERRAAEVRGVRALLDVNPPLSLLSEGSVRGLQKDVEHQRALLLRSVEAWQALVERSKASVLQREMEDSRTSKIPNKNDDKSKSDNGSVQGASASTTKSESAIKLKATATLVPRTDTANKRGHLTMPVEAFSDAWIRRWFVLKRPYLFVYENSSELDELMVIHLGAVRVEHDTNIESMLNRQNVFGLYTASNSYFLQAATEAEMQQWMNSLSIRR